MAKTMFNGQEVECEEYTPTWESVLPIYLTAYENGNRVALSELTRMAKSLDEKNDQVQGFLAKMNENETKISDLEKQLETLTFENETRKKVVTSLVNLVKDHDRQGTSYQDMIRNLESRLNDLETELEYFKNAQND